MMRILYFSGSGEVRADAAPESLPDLLRDVDGMLWLDLREESPDACAPILRDIFAFHPLAIDDALEESHVPKIDDWGKYLYLVLHAVRYDPQDNHIDTLELDVFVGSHYLVTHQTTPLKAVDRVWALCQRDERHLRKGAAHLLYKLADELAADYMPVVEDIDVTIDEIEDQVFGNPAPGVLEQIFGLKRALLTLRRIIGPQREVLNKLGRGDYAVIPPDYSVFFRDVYDHLVRLYDISESLRDLVGGALDTYLSVVSNRMNEVMKTLTVITTMFMPISFIAGFFGMNFFQPALTLDNWTGRGAFVAMLALMFLVPVGMYIWMRKRAWM
ncbi:MAG TPA: magnesium/cobalt transporter CorA [Anaerolineae bacterium]|nr:magnesium/cobalt transporter CorA [Anaerolineae bacterium]HQK12661.1 magnesium/cobalt transporter CorA [Anaerolineae bacterium]